MRISPTEFNELVPELIQAQGCQWHVDQAPGFAKTVVRQVRIRDLATKC